MPSMLLITRFWAALFAKRSGPIDTNALVRSSVVQIMTRFHMQAYFAAVTSSHAAPMARLPPGCHLSGCCSPAGGYPKLSGPGWLPAPLAPGCASPVTRDDPVSFRRTPGVRRIHMDRCGVSQDWTDHPPCRLHGVLTHKGRRLTPHSISPEPLVGHLLVDRPGERDGGSAPPSHLS